MIEAQFFDKLNALAKSMRGNELPFGGIQIILCGDFLQLPPRIDVIISDKTSSFCL